MNLTDKLVPHMIFLAALLPTFLLLVAAAVSLAEPRPSLAVPLPIQATVCQPCQTPQPQ